VGLPADAREAKKLKGLRLKVAHIPSPYREEAISFAVSLDRRPTSS